MINVFTARCIFSLLDDQWWIERYADDVVIVLKVVRKYYWMNNLVISEMCKDCAGYSIPHILEEESEDQEDEKDNQ